MEKGLTMTLEERVNRMSLQELRQELLKAKVRQNKNTIRVGEWVRRKNGGPEQGRHSLGTEEARRLVVRDILHSRCSHQLHRAKWIPGPFNISGTNQWMVPTVCEKCGELVRKFVEVR